MRQHMPFTAVLEIGREQNGEIPAQLISAAFRASRAAPVLLVLDSISRAEVDRILDAVVNAGDLGSAGVLYADIEDEATVLAAAARTRLVLARSEGFRAKLASRGISLRSFAEVEGELARVAS